VRPGPDGPQHYNDVDAISIEHANNVIVDHCSLSWDIDETLAIKGVWWNTHGKEYYQETHDITVQYCIMSESLNRSRHGAHVPAGQIGAHSKSVQMDGGANRISMHHNLIMHGDMRNPLFPCEGAEPIVVDFVNNIIYNFGIRAGDSHKKTNHSVDLNFVGNQYIMGPNSEKIGVLQLGVDTRVYARGNIGPIRTALDQDEYAGIKWIGPRERDGLQAKERFDVAPPVTTYPYEEAYRVALAQAGASLPKRDAVDRRLIEEVKARKGQFVDHPSDVGGWPELRSAAAPKDEDEDGMPDEWEVKHGLNASAGWDHRGDEDGDGYTNIEEYLNGTNP
jgi:pectate lyase